jgi:hypothetical protein
MDEAVVNVYGEGGVKIRYCMRDLMWRPVGRLVRFVAVIPSDRVWRFRFLGHACSIAREFNPAEKRRPALSGQRRERAGAARRGRVSADRQI